MFIIFRYGKISKIPWREEAVNFGPIMGSLLVGLPVYCVVGLCLGFFFLKAVILHQNGIYLKYCKDCSKMRDVSAIGYDCIDKNTKIHLVKWWNGEDELIE